ncbi:MAG: hypothetical protein ACRES9_08510 [Gammaproteobacteria bacterium]
MITLPIIAVISSLTLAPAPSAAATPSHAVAARQRLDHLTVAAASRLRAQAIERGLAEGRVAFETDLKELNVRMANRERQRSAVFVTASNKPR